MKHEIINIMKSEDITATHVNTLYYVSLRLWLIIAVGQR